MGPRRRRPRLRGRRGQDAPLKALSYSYPKVSVRRLAAFFSVLALACLVPALAHAAGGEFDAALGQGWFWVYLAVFGAGFATSLTPCVYPMLPIVVGIFGAKQASSRLVSFLLAGSYVLGMGVMYSALGVGVALAGGQFGTVLAEPAVVIPIVFVYVALAVSMFGAFELQLPAGLQAKLSSVGGQGFGGAFGMGLVGGLTAAPCTGPMLAGLLTYVSTTGSVMLGFTLLFTFALGMGVLIFVLAVTAVKLPKSGRWMDTVKSVGGVALLVLALYFLRPIWPGLRDAVIHAAWFPLAAGALAVIGLALGALHLSFSQDTAVRVRKGVGVVFMVTGLFGALNWWLKPPPLAWGHDEVVAMAESRERSAPVLVDFGAEWCLPCKEYERNVFGHPDVHAFLESQYVLLKFDLTETSDADFDAKEKWSADQLPTVIIVDSSGNETRRFSEPIPTPNEFLEALEAAL